MKNISYEPFPLQNGMVIALQAPDGRFVSRINYGGEGGINHLEIAKSPMDVFCRLTVTLLDDGKVALQAENGFYLRNVDTKLHWIMAEERPIDAACHFSPVKVSADKIAFQTSSGFYIGYSKTQKFASRFPLSATKPEPTAESSFILHVLGDKA